MENAPPPSSPPAFQPSPVPPSNPNAARTWEMLCHISALAGFIPLGNILGPLIIWQMKRNEFPSVDVHGKASLNFQLSVLIYLMAVGVLGFIGSLMCLGIIFIPLMIIVLPVIHFGSLILAIIAGIKANDGIIYRYPMTLRLIN